jgi:hypothetical protein
MGFINQLITEGHHPVEESKRKIPKQKKKCPVRAGGAQQPAKVFHPQMAISGNYGIHWNFPMGC